MSDETIGRPSTPSLFADALSQMTALFQTEIRLARTEVGEKLSGAILSAAVLVASALLLFVAVILLLEGVVQLLVAFGWQPYAANFIVGGVIAVFGIVAVVIAVRGLSARALTPARTIDQFGKDARLAQEQVR